MQTYRRSLTLSLLFISLTFPALGQNWARPSTSPRTTVPCPGCSNSVTDAYTVGYEPGITFTGRFLDSNATSDYQGTFRTARAASVYADRASNRLYLRIGASVAAYNMNNFFSRLEAHEALWPSTSVPVKPLNARPAGQVEVFLKWDDYFYAEYNLSGWITPKQDKQDTLFGFDVDDEHYVYLAHSLFGWGIVKDGMSTGSATLMPTQKQIPDVPGTKVLAFKSDSGNRYAFVSSGSNNMTIYNVNDRRNPVSLGKAARGVQWFAKNTAQTVAAVVDYGQNLNIYTADAFANGGGPVYSESGCPCRGVSTDGTNFYTTKATANGLSIVVLKPSGSSYSRQEYSAGGPHTVTNIQQGDGFITISGIDGEGAWDLRVFKLSNSGVPQALNIKSFPASAPYTSYFRSYYSRAPIAPPTTYVTPGTLNLVDSTIVKANGKIYLVVCGYGIGDVYELPSGPSINIAVSKSGAVNPFMPADRVAPTFYADPITLVGNPTENTVSTISWNFGNPEAGSIANAGTTAAGGAITMQYSNLTAPDFGGGGTTRTVIATSLNDASVKGTTPIKLDMPVARIKLIGAGATASFTQAGTTTAPIVLGDSFADASDGRVEGHYSAWTLDGALTKSLPSIQLPVGGCGAHNVTLASQYGPYFGSGPTLGTNGTNFPVTVGGVGYTVRPFAAGVDLDLAGSLGSPNLNFRSSSRMTSDATAAAQINGLVYRVELVDSVGNAVPSVAPQSGSGMPPIALYQVPRTAIAGSRGMRVKLTLNAAASGCAGLETSVAYSAPLNGPDPGPISQSGTCNNGPCTFTTNSQTSGLDTVADGWTYQWQVLSGGSVVPNSAFTAQSSTTKSFTPTFLQTGTFTVKVKVTNAIGVSEVTSQAFVVTTAATLCKAMTTSSINVTWNGQTSNCSPGIACLAGEQVQFFAHPLLGSNYDDTCAPHSYSWSFGDGGTSAATEPTHIFSANSTYNVVVTVTNLSTSEHQNFSGSVQVGSTQPPPPPACTVSQQSIIPSYSAPNGGSGCSSANGLPCKNNEMLSFSVSAPATCSNTYSWVFDGSAPVTGTNVQRSFAATGTHSVVVNVTNAASGTSGQRFVNLSTSDNVGNGPCGLISPNTSLWIDYHNAIATCGTGSPSGCGVGEPVTFNVNDFAPYNINCATHTFDWDFGDGSAHRTERAPVHTFVASATFPVTCKVSNGTQNVTLSQNVVVGNGNPIGTDVKVSITISKLGGTPNGFVFTPKFDRPELVTRWTWDFGDNSTVVTGSGTPSSPANENHTYADGSARTVTLIAYNGTQPVGTKSQLVQVTEPVRRRSVKH